MRPTLIFIAGTIMLASCNKGPQVNLKNASANEVAKAVQQSGVMTSDTMFEPGLWQSKVTIQEMNIPGLPPQYEDKIKQSMAAHQEQSSTHCLTPDQVKKPKEDFFAGQDKSCSYQHFTMGAGKIDVQMDCKAENSNQSTNMSGTYTPTTYSLDMSSTGSGGPGQTMTMKMHVDSRRVGECTGEKE